MRKTITILATAVVALIFWIFTESRPVAYYLGGLLVGQFFYMNKETGEARLFSRHVVKTSVGIKNVKIKS